MEEMVNILSCFSESIGKGQPLRPERPQWKSHVPLTFSFKGKILTILDEYRFHKTWQTIYSTKHGRQLIRYKPSFFCYLNHYNIM
jgi:hypothetical protein